MLAIALACCLVTNDSPPGASAADLALYDAAKVKVGRDADAQVRLALWCESRGLTSERIHHLATAVALDPGHSAARGLLGLVADGPRWRRPDDIAERLRNDPDRSKLLEEYSNRRAKTPATADGQWDLALWCEKADLKDEARAHFAATVRIDPSREAAWKRLGCKKVGDQWLSAAEVTQRKEEWDAQRAADRRWKATLTSLKDRLRQPSRRAQAESDLAAVTDPRSVPSILRVFGATSRAVQLLGQEVDGPMASHALAMLAILAPTDPVRRAASETLGRRDPREFVSTLVAAIVPKVRYQVRHVGGPGDVGVLFIEGKEFNRRRTYSPSPPPMNLVQPGDAWDFDEFGMPVLIRLLGYASNETPTADMKGAAVADLNRSPAIPSGTSPVFASLLGKGAQARYAADSELIAGIDRTIPGSRVRSTTPLYATIPVGRMEIEAERSAVAAEVQLAADVAAIESYNEAVNRFDERISAVLASIAGVDYRDDVASWQRWSADLRGYASTAPPQSTRPTFDEDVPIGYQPSQLPIGIVAGQTSTSIVHSCFAAGTPVRTIGGPRAIEGLATGDIVLSRDVETGRLAFRPVIAVYHNPPAATIRVGFGNRDVVATGIHRFWKAGAGWTMARDLKPGDLIRTVEGVAKVLTVDPAPRQKVYNLLVDGGHSFFVGEVGAMVHDNSLVRPTSMAFDHMTQLAAPDESPEARR